MHEVYENTSRASIQFDLKRPIASALQDLLRKARIEPIQIYPKSPCETGDNVRLNGTRRREVLNAEWFHTNASRSFLALPTELDEPSSYLNQPIIFGTEPDDVLPVLRAIERHHRLDQIDKSCERIGHRGEVRQTTGNKVTQFISEGVQQSGAS